MMSGAMGATKIAAGGAVVGIAALAYGIGNSVKAGIGLQSQQVQLQQALKATGNQGAQAYNQMNDAAVALAGKGGFGVQEQLQGMAQFVRLTGSATQATKLNAAATNLARGAHLGFNQAQRMLSMATVGSTGRLQRYLGVIQPVTSYTASWTAAMKKANPEGYKHAEMLNKQATAQEALARIQQKYGGAAKAYSGTAAGGLSNLKQQWDVIKEDLGKAFLPLVSTITGVLTKVMPSINRLFTAIAKPLAATLQKLLPPLVAGLQQLLPPIFSIIQQLLPPLLGAINSVIPTLAAAVQTLMPVIDRALQVILPPLVHLFNIAMPIIARTLAQVLPPLISMFSTIMPVLVRAFQIMAPPLMRALSEMVTALAPAMAAMVKQVAPLIPQLAHAIVSVMVPLAKAILMLIPAVAPLVASLLPAFIQAFKVLAPILTKVLTLMLPAVKLLASAMSAVSPVAKGLTSGAPVHFGGGGILSDVGNFIFNPFGRFDSSKPIHRAGGGPVPGSGYGDTVSAMLTPGEYVVQKQIVNQVGMPAMQRFNQTGQIGGDTVFEIQPQPIMLDGRRIAEVVLRVAKKQAARGHGTLAGGSLVVS
jgi:hypothetical protein